MRWRWIGINSVFAIHDEQLAEFGGLDGVRDVGAIESALARPQHLAAYGDPDISDLAAAIAFGIAKNHGFSDGAKRTAFVVSAVFALKNGYEITAPEDEVVVVMNDVAGGVMSEAQLAAWFRDHLVHG